MLLTLRQRGAHGACAPRPTGMRTACVSCTECAHVAYASGCSDGKVVVWDTSSLQALLTLEGHKGPVLSCSVNEESTCIVTGGECNLNEWQ